MNKCRTVKKFVLLAAALAMLASAGCHKLKKEDQFYELRVPEEKLKQIQTLDLKSRPAEDAGLPSEANEAPTHMEVSLEESRALALANNLDIQASLIAPSIARAELLAEEAKFEAAFTAGATLLRSDEPGGKIVGIPDTSTFITSIDSSQRENTNVDLGVRVPLQTGGTISFNLADGRSKNFRDNSPLSPWYQDRFQISISQPLLRNAGQRANLRNPRLFDKIRWELDRFEFPVSLLLSSPGDV